MQRWTVLSQRTQVLIIGGVLSAALIALGSSIPVPYVALGPGDTFDTLTEAHGEEMITFSGPDIPASVDETFANPGHLNLTTISVTDGLPLFAALGMWAQGDYALVPREDMFPPGQTPQEVTERNAQLFRDSLSAAELSALEYLKYPTVVYAGTIEAGTPAAGKLQPQDRITAIDGRPVTDLASLRKVLATLKPGTTVGVSVLRGPDGQEKKVQVDVTLGTHPDPKRAGTGFLGIEPQERPEAPFQIDITLDKIGGPSAGLMFTLGIIDKLTPGDLTGGRFVAGTGEIDPYSDPDTSPKVGAIGGVLMKMIAARDVGATVFFVPAPNCEEAVTRVPDGLTLVKVATLDDAMAALKQLQAGQTPPSC